MAAYEVDFDNRTSDNDIYEFCQLTDFLISDIQDLESEIVRLRYELSRCMSKQNNEMLSCDFLSDLAGRYYWDKAYKQYISKYCNGNDPMDSDKYVEHLLKLSHGKDEHDIG
jgi:hypothetical protein